MTNTSKQYALALFSLALDQKQTDDVFQEFHQFTDAIDALAWKFFLNPKIEDHEKHQVIENVLKNKLLIDFFKTVIDNKRFNYVKEMMVAYKALLNEKRGIAELVVYTKNALSKTNKDKLKKKFENQLNKKIIINEVVNSSIMGGIRIEYQGKVLDQTINASLDDLKSSLIG
jgi:F-type H+-transporting ATPase subunit delta